MDKKRLVGAVVSVGALRGSDPVAVGEFPDLKEFAVLCKKMGIGLIQLLPVNDTGYESSPYFSLTSVALHPLYLRIADLPEAKGFTEKAAGINREFAGEVRFAYLKVLRAKMALLREIYAASASEIEKSATGGSLAKWIEQNAWVKQYSVYRRTKEANGERSWKEWSANREMSAGEIEEMWNDKKLRPQHLFWAWLQEALDRQFDEAAKAVAGCGIMLKGDLPILMNDDSCDVWANKDLFVQELSAGAPPDMYSLEGQNWGFPLYNWAAHEKDGFAWWKQRLAVAGKYYQAYRIDHVLGFFRIWSASRSDHSSILGRYIPYTPVTSGDLAKLGFDKGRIRWISRPHIPTGELYEEIKSGCGNDGEAAACASKVFSEVLDRIGNEDLWMFKPCIGGEKDIEAMALHPAAIAALVKAWHDRTFVEYEKNLFSPTWHYRDSRAYKSLSLEERQKLEALLESHTAKSQKVWEAQGQKLLSVLCESSPMLPCAEDLGAVPACVPKVLGKLKIMGLRVVRWHRDWETDEQPYIPFREYPELSVCTPAVHDSSTVREWWEREADQQQLAGFMGFPSLPKVYNPGTAKAVLSKTASAKSRIRVFQIQDLLHLSSKWYATDLASERMNIPGTYNEFNWTYRLPAAMAEIAADAELVNAVLDIVAVPASSSPAKSTGKQADK